MQVATISNKLTLDAKEFKTAIAQLKKVVPTRPTHPILSYVKLDFSANKLRFTATNLRTWLSKKFDYANPGENFKPVCIQFNVLEAFAKSIKPKKKNVVEIELLDDGTCKLSCGAIVLTHSTQSVDEFPDAPILPQDAPCFSIASVSFIDALNKTIYAASNDETKQVLQGVNIVHDGRILTAQHDEDSCLKFSSTDGHRIAIFTIKNQSLGGDFSITPHWYDLDILSKVFDKKLHIHASFIKDGNFGYCHFTDGLTTLVCCNLQGEFQGKFPKIEQLILTEPNLKLHIDKLALLEQLKAAANVCGKRKDVAVVEINKETIIVHYVDKTTPRYSDLDKYQGLDHNRTYALNIPNTQVKLEGEEIPDLRNAIAFNLLYFIELLSMVSQNAIVLEAKARARDNICTQVFDGEATHILARVELKE